MSNWRPLLCCIYALQTVTLHFHSLGASTALHFAALNDVMAAVLISWRHIRNQKSDDSINRCVYLSVNRAKFNPDQIWNDAALELAPTTTTTTTTTTTSWVAASDVSCWSISLLNTHVIMHVCVNVYSLCLSNSSWIKCITVSGLRSIYNCFNCHTWNMTRSTSSS